MQLGHFTIVKNEITNSKTLKLFQGTLFRLSTLRLTTSHTYYYKKIDEFGEKFDAGILEAVQKEGRHMQGNQTGRGPAPSQGQHATPNACEEPSPHVVVEADKGRKLVFDNFDFRQQVHHMTQDHQNVDVHWVSHMAVENRVSGNHLPYDRPVCQIQDLENGQCLPGRHEQHLQRENYITLTERAIVQIPCLSFLKGVVVQHIPHHYSKEMSETSSTVSFQVEIFNVFQY